MNDAREIRRTKRQQIEEFFAANAGREYSTFDLHMRFGTAFRSRASDINRDPHATVTIHNRTGVENGKEVSVYWAELRSDGVQRRLPLGDVA